MDIQCDVFPLKAFMYTSTCTHGTYKYKYSN